MMSNVLKNLKIRPILWAILIVLSPSVSAMPINTQQQEILDHIPVNVNGITETMTLKEAMNYFKVPSISFAVIQNNQIDWVYAVGYVDAEKTKPANSETLFQAGSLSKSVTALTALALVEKGILKLDAPINPLLKGWEINPPAIYRHDTITLRQLLSMSSGLNVPNYEGYTPNQPLPSLVQTLQNSGVAMMCKPGQKYTYSSGGYQVIQLLIQSRTSKEFPKIAQQFMLDPLEMKNTHYESPLPANKNVAQATDNNGRAFPYPWRIHPELASAGLWSTPTDLAKLTMEIMKAYEGKSSLLSKALIREALTKQENTPYGLGFSLAGFEKKLHFMKLGLSSGYQGWLIGYPETGQGAVVMTNADRGAELSQAVIYAIAKAYQWPTDGELKDIWMIK